MSGTGKKIDGISKKKDCVKVGRWKKKCHKPHVLVRSHYRWWWWWWWGHQGGKMVVDNKPHKKQAFMPWQQAIFQMCSWKIGGSWQDKEMARCWFVKNYYFNFTFQGNKCLSRFRNYTDLGTTAYAKLSELLTKTSLLKDVCQMSGEFTTSSLESFHSVLNHFAPKLLGFSYYGMTSR